MTTDRLVKVVVSPSGSPTDTDVTEKLEKVEIDTATAVEIGLMLSMISLGIFNTRRCSKSYVFDNIYY